MIRAYLAGARAALRRWSLIVVLWVIGAAFGLAFALASGTWLSGALESSLATRTLFRQLDPDIFVDLWYHHREGLEMLLVTAVVLAVFHTVLWWWLYGVVICRVQRPADEWGDAWLQGAAYAPVMAQLFVLALVVLAAFSASIGAGAYVLLRWTRSSPAALIWDQILGAAALVWSVGYVFLVAVHDHARLRACRTQEGALTAYRWAFGFVRGGGEGAFPLACALQFSAVLLWLGYQVVGLSVPMTALLGLTGSLLWGELFMLVRLWVRVWFFAAQNELQT